MKEEGLGKPMSQWISVGTVKSTFEPIGVEVEETGPFRAAPIVVLGKYGLRTVQARALAALLTVAADEIDSWSEADDVKDVE